MIATRLSLRIHPAIIAVSHNAVLPVQASTDSDAGCYPFTHTEVDAKRLSVGEHMSKVLTISIQERHTQTCLNKPVIPDAVKNHCILCVLRLV